MKRPTDNPVYDRLTRGDKGPSARAARWIGVGIVLGGFTLSLLPVLTPGFWMLDSAPAVLLFGLTLLVALLTPFVGLALAGGLMCRIVTGEDWALLRLTNFPSDQIESGCVAGISDRLGLLHMVGLWALPGGLVGCACVIGKVIVLNLFGPPVPSISLVDAVDGAPYALFAVALSTRIFQPVWQWCIQIGVWLALQWHKRAPAIAGGVALAGAVVYGLILTYFFGRFNANDFLMPIPLVCLTALVIPVALIGILGRIAHNRSIRLIEGLAGSDSDDLIID